MTSTKIEASAKESCVPVSSHAKPRWSVCTHDSLAEASIFVEVIEKRQGLKIACLEGIAYRNGWITADKLRALAEPMLRNQYGQYLLKLLDEK